MPVVQGFAPECPACGCNATRIVAGGEQFGRAWARFECDFCRRAFTIGRSPATDEVVNGVVYHPVRCPKCKSKDCPVHTSRGVKRYHRCRNCGQQFKSVEAS